MDKIHERFKFCYSIVSVLYGLLMYVCKGARITTTISETKYWAYYVSSEKQPDRFFVIERNPCIWFDVSGSISKGLSSGSWYRRVCSSCLVRPTITFQLKRSSMVHCCRTPLASHTWRWAGYVGSIASRS